MMAEDGVRDVFHACGQDHLAFGHSDVAITRVPVYAADVAGQLPVPKDSTVALLKKLGGRETDKAFLTR